MSKRKTKAIVWKAVLEHFSGDVERVILPAFSRSDAFQSLPNSCEVLYLKPCPELHVDQFRLYSDLAASGWRQDELDLIIAALHNYLSEEVFL